MPLPEGGFREARTMVRRQTLRQALRQTLRQTLRPATLMLLSFPVLVGCAGMPSYSERATVTPSRYTTIENFSDVAISAEEVDGLLLDVADLLGVRLEAGKPKARIIVTTPSRIAGLYRAGAATLGGHAQAVGLYYPAASLVLVPYFDREILGHELAHYLTDHYLKSTPRGDWEKIAYRVQRQIGSHTRVAQGTAPVLVAERATPAPLVQ